jgi:type I restriction enzyme R subunit
MYSEQNKWLDAFSMVPFEDKSGAWKPRYYQEIAASQQTLPAMVHSYDFLFVI